MISSFKNKLKRSDLFLIAANLLPVIGVWYFNWNPAEVFMVYALETIIIGFFTLIKMGIVTLVRKTDIWYNKGSTQLVSGLFFMLFFMVHYGMFVAIQTGMFITISGIGKEFHLGFFEFFLHWPSYFKGDLLYMLLGFFISYGFNLYWNFIRPGIYRNVPMMLLMFQPYERIFVQQFIVILGSMFLTFGAGKIFILIFAAVKIFVEVFLNFEGILNKSMQDMRKESGQQ
ncbi:MAG: hypothetical protein IT214_00910 [Chitinophagaceae bacterium]|nr:hypothetical protein [Chitinophagaceae bacterium]OQY95095.1 MAG: hypothetical protein B6D37_06910 [Sphingobacteriales bacterium UTBCD1]